MMLSIIIIPDLVFGCQQVLLAGIWKGVVIIRKLMLCMCCNDRHLKMCQPCGVAVVSSTSCYVGFYQCAIKAQEQREVTKWAKSHQDADAKAIATELLIIVPVVLGSTSNDSVVLLKRNDILQIFQEYERQLYPQGTSTYTQRCQVCFK